MFEILKSIQAQRAEHGGRLASNEDLVRKPCRDTARLLVMAKSVTGDFAEQVAAIEEQVTALEARRS
jgi:hypothetical protein